MLLTILKSVAVLAVISQQCYAEKKPLTIDEAIARDERKDPVVVDHVVDLDERLSTDQWNAVENPAKDVGSGAKRNALKDLTERWTNGVIPFIINPQFNVQERRVILSAMREWASYTCLTFRLYRPGDQHAIIVQNTGGCWSWIGMQQKRQKQRLTLGPSCVYKGIVVHELGHALGFMHEQARPDRDRFVKIVWQNIQQKEKYNFKKAPARMTATFNKPYDYASIMHYGKYEFSGNKRPTVLTTNQFKRYEKYIGNRYGVSFWDVRSANLMYGCSRRCRTRCAKGFVGPDCQCWCQGPSLRKPIVYCKTGNPVGRTRIGSVPKARRPNRFPNMCRDRNILCSVYRRKNMCFQMRVRAVCRRSCGNC